MSPVDKHSKRISFWLRHQPSDASLVPDPFGWVNLDELLAALERLGTPVAEADLIAYNQQSDKTRWQIDPAQRRMRATHGHTFSIMQDREPSIPPPVLYHGTAAHTVEAIQREGILPMQRQFVHLSTTPAAAMQVGSRHGQPVLLRVHTEPLVAKGQLFYQTGETIWLTTGIEPGCVD